MMKFTRYNKGENMLAILREFRANLDKEDNIAGEVGNVDAPIINFKMYTKEDLKILEEFLQGNNPRHLKVETSFKGGEIELAFINKENSKYLFTMDFNLLPLYLEFKNTISKR